MSDPKRFADRGDLGASLLQAGRSLDTARARERRRAVIGAGAGAALASAITAKVLPKSVLHLAFGKWLLLGVVAAAGVVPVVHALSPTPPPAASPAPVSAPMLRGAAAVPEASATPRPEPTVLAAPDPAPAPPPAHGDPPARSKAAGPPDPAPAAPPPSAEPSAPSADPVQTLAEEVAAVRSARAALGEGQPRQALTLLDDHDHRFPRGRLGIEAEVVRIEALALSGNAGAARTRAQAFLAAHPDTPYASRVRVHVGGDPTKP